jgi:hypothetical protein
LNHEYRSCPIEFASSTETTEERQVIRVSVNEIHASETLYWGDCGVSGIRLVSAAEAAGSGAAVLIRSVNISRLRAEAKSAPDEDNLKICGR